MDEVQRNLNLSGLNELERAFQTYKEKLAEAEREASEVTESAWKKAERLIADKQEEAQRIADDVKRKAQQEADRVIWEANSKAVVIEREATDKAKKEAMPPAIKAAVRSKINSPRLMLFMISITATIAPFLAFSRV